MSTRANVKIVTQTGEVLWLYKHHDGYPTHTGDLLHWEFTTNSELTYVVDTLIEKGFEITDKEHGDINWLYTISLTADEIDLEIVEYHFVNSLVTPKARDTRFSWLGSDAEVWNQYKLYESKMAVNEAKHRVRHYESLCTPTPSKANFIKRIPAYPNKKFQEVQ